MDIHYGYTLITNKKTFLSPADVEKFFTQKSEKF